jgi:uncharacterized protein
VLTSSTTGHLAGQNALPPVTGKSSIMLHLGPGAAIFAVFALLVWVIGGRSTPPQLSLLVAFIAIGVPLELGYLLWQRQRRHAASLRDVILLRERLSAGRTAGWVAGLTVWGLVAFTATAPLAAWLRNTVFAWWPQELLLADLVTDTARYDRTALWVVLALSAVANVVVPIVEELYFRGHLLARMRQSPWTPMLNVALFSLYHFWAPWEFFSRMLALTPMVYVVWRERNVRIAVWVHVLINSSGTIALAGLLATSA